MSVAFRRDCDEEHLEPRFELPIPPGPNLVTPRGYALIAARVAELETGLAGDLGADERKALLRDAQYWRSRLTSAQVMSAPSGETVAIGTRVTIDRDGQARTFEIVGHDESDPGSDRIAFASPLARALIGAEVGQVLDLPNSDDPITVTAIAVA
ncbi:MAG: GreA/GreB family elongation factor [Pseudomonadota bacterium]|nr:GreA/GreB family elongation factor [Sphingomonas sp.]MDQ3478315.1 GreA/GreB family elongation factor [Pseudomonadota bacterium]